MTPQPLNVTPAELFAQIGRLTVENQILRGQLIAIQQEQQAAAKTAAVNRFASENGEAGAADGGVIGKIEGS